MRQARNASEYAALTGHIAVVSPHLDDAVISLGASLHWAVRRGARVTVVTVFAGDVESRRAAGYWDAAAGFATEVEAARARRAEDARACALIGAEARWLPFSDDQYAGTRDQQAVLAALKVAVEGCDLMLIPGFPLVHDDHRWVSMAVLRDGLMAGSTALYAEQPYRYWQHRERPALEVPPALQSLLAIPAPWSGVAARPADLLAKWRAIRAYRTQLPLLKQRGRLLKPFTMIVREHLGGGEAVSFIVRT